MKKCKVIFDISEETRSYIKNNYAKSEVSSLYKSRITERGCNVLGNTTYSYLCPIEDVSVGDLVVVETKNTVALATFIGFDPISPKGLELKMVVAKVDLTTYEELKQKEYRKKELMELMNDRKKDLEETTIFMMLAEKDPQMKAMLEEFTTLNNGEPTAKRKVVKK